MTALEQLFGLAFLPSLLLLRRRRSVGLCGCAGSSAAAAAEAVNVGGVILPMTVQSGVFGIYNSTIIIIANTHDEIDVMFSVGTV